MLLTKKYNSQEVHTTNSDSKEQTSERNHYWWAFRQKWSLFSVGCQNCSYVTDVRLMYTRRDCDTIDCSERNFRCSFRVSHFSESLNYYISSYPLQGSTSCCLNSNFNETTTTNPREMKPRPTDAWYVIEK